MSSQSCGSTSTKTAVTRFNGQRKASHIDRVMVGLGAAFEAKIRLGKKRDETNALNFR